MEEKLEITKRFFKVMMPGFHEKLNLPLAFCQKVKKQVSQSEWANVKSRKGTWKIKVCRNNEGLMSFKDGWANFVNEHGLSVGDFVVFEHIGHLHFNAFVFDPSACEREFLVEMERGHKGVNGNYNPRNKGKPTKESTISYNSENPHFILTAQPHHADRNSQVTIPVEFCKSNDLRNLSTVTLRDPHGKQWLVKLSIPGKGRFRCRMSRGWYEFYVSNKLKDGDVCVFDLNGGSGRSRKFLMDVQIFPAPL